MYADMDLLYLSQKKTMKHIAIKVPMIIPSLLFLLVMRPMMELMPGTLLAAIVILRLMLANVSLCTMKLSLMAYAWLRTLSVTSLLLSMRFRSSSM